MVIYSPRPPHDLAVRNDDGTFLLVYLNVGFVSQEKVETPDVGNNNENFLITYLYFVLWFQKIRFSCE